MSETQADDLAASALLAHAADGWEEPPEETGDGEDDALKDTVEATATPAAPAAADGTDEERVAQLAARRPEGGRETICR